MIELVTELLPPRPETLARYGLTLESWNYLADLQGRICPIHGRLPSTGRLNIDHRHVNGWAQMSPGQRALYIRGLICWTCNRLYVGRGITVQISEAVTAYLKRPPPFTLARGPVPLVLPP